MPIVRCPDVEARERFPTLLEFMESTSYADGQRREKSTVTLFVQGEECRASLGDHDNSRSCFASAGTFLEALEALEAVLSTGSASWRWKDPDDGKWKRKK